MHAYWQGYAKEPAAKEFATRKACTIASSKAGGTHWNLIKCKQHLGNHPEAIIDEFGNPLRIPFPSCTALT
jgi:hypothetical protein